MSINKRKLYESTYTKSYNTFVHCSFYDFYNFTSAYIILLYITTYILKKYFDDFEIRKIPNKVRSMTHR